MSRIKDTQQPHEFEESAYQRTILRALNGPNGWGRERHIYTGTVPAKTIAKRRRRNKLARVSRRINRSRS